jgi:hypothetical protein
MATLVLSVAGGIFGGPIGAALGSLAGQAIDHNVIFKPKGREGPRLSDLAVQTSSYGTPIPRIFGTMRVAGSVIWSTDLIETRSKSSGGKGQPTVTNYSYSASFAVLLSARAIQGVGRIWADGKLLRGSAGDFKSQTDFRLHAGSEDQPVDPLIAAAEGAGLAPAHRGLAYAVFENFQLADYGNRIPSLTFEVIADAATVPVDVIAADISGGIVRGDGAGPSLIGFSAYGDSARSVLETLATIGGGWFADDGAVLTMRHSAVPVRSIADDGFAAQTAKGERGTRRARSIAALDGVAQRLSLAYYDPARDYQTNIQQARRPGPGTRQERIDLPAVVDAGAAKAIAQNALLRADAAREKRSIATAWQAIDLVPGDALTIVGEPGLWRIDGWSLEAIVLTLDLVRVTSASASHETASAGRVLGSADLLHGPSVIVAAELPPLDDALLAMPRLVIAAAGPEPGWRQAALLLSTDGGTRYTGLGATAAPATLGAIVMPPGPASSLLIDCINSVEVDLLHPLMALGPADDAALDHGANLALIGGELIQFGSAMPIEPRRWRLARLRRGLRGTEAAIGGQMAGDRFLLIDAETMIAADLPLSAIGGTATVLASGVGDRPGPARADAAITGASVLPPSPAQVRARRLANGDVTITWVRRSRLGWRWIDAVDAPLGEESERYSVVVITAGARSVIERDRPEVTLPAAMIADGTVISIRQLGNAGESAPASITLTI